MTKSNQNSSCPSCESTNIRAAGVLIRGKDLTRYKRFHCKDCDHRFEEIDGVKEETTEETIYTSKERKYIISSVLNNTSVDAKFLATLKHYAKLNKAKLKLIPVRYIINTEGEGVEYPIESSEYLIEDNLILEHGKVKILGGLRISATAENPLSGIDPMSKGYSLVIGHPQVQMRTLPVLQNEDITAPILFTTGTISNPAYSDTKLGYKATFNHSMSALIVHVKANGTLHIRNLNWDGQGFNDLDTYYSGTSSKKQSVDTLVTGDEHVMFMDWKVAEATYKSDQSIVNVLKPKTIIRHDVLDCYSISHHHNKDFVKKFYKSVKGLDDIKSELDLTIDFIRETTPVYSKSVLISSNHNDHLMQWLNSSDSKSDTKNALIYHELMYRVLSAVSNDESTIDPFELYAKAKIGNRVSFSGAKSIKIFDIELGLHGHRAAGGARGSRASFAKLPEKCVIGHSHSPGWEKGCVQVGTSSLLDMEYTVGAPSSWRHCHCLIHKNGKRQLVFITNGEWR